MLTDAYMMSVHVVDAMKLGPYWELRFWTYVIAVLLSKNIFLQQWVQMSIRISNWRLEVHPSLISTHETFHAADNALSTHLHFGCTLSTIVRQQ